MGQQHVFQRVVEANVVRITDGSWFSSEEIASYQALLRSTMTTGAYERTRAYATDGRARGV
jgi:hypothetical protein